MIKTVGATECTINDMNRKPEIIICNDINGIAEKTATAFVKTAEMAISKRGAFRVALSGGSTPRYLYDLLSTDEFIEKTNWSKTHLFWGDERCVPSDDVMSNYRMAFETLISKLKGISKNSDFFVRVRKRRAQNHSVYVIHEDSSTELTQLSRKKCIFRSVLNLPQENIHRIKGEMGEKAAVEYEDEIKKVFETEYGAFPEFDLILLGMGEDGHTASIFPDTHAVKEDKKVAVAVTEDKVNIPRITLTPPVINNALNIMFLVAGRNKSSILKEVIEGDLEPERFPAQITRHSKGRVRWFVDSKAAAKLSRTHTCLNL